MIFAAAFDRLLPERVADVNEKTGTPLPPAISVRFEEAFGVALTFDCFRVQAVERREIRDVSGR